MPEKNANKFTTHFTAILLVAVVLGSLAVTWAFPIYFRTDDVIYLEWANEHTNPVDAFSPEKGELFGGFRPAQNLAWWTLFHLFGISPGPYQFVLFFLYGLSFVFFFLVCREIYSFSVAAFALLAYGILFQYLLHIPFWFSDLTFILELFFIHLALYLLVLAAKKDIRYAIFGCLIYIVAVLAKEPASLLVPVVFGFYLFVSWKSIDQTRRRKMIYVLAGISIAGILYVMLNPFLAHRQGLDPGKGIGAFAHFAFVRWRFYAGRLLAGPGLLLSFSIFYLLICHFIASKKKNDITRTIMPMVIAAVLALIAKPFPAAALLLLFIVGLVLVVLKNNAAIAVGWFAIPLVGILTVHFVVRTYLVEASFGFAILSGLALTDLGRNMNQWRIRMAPKAEKALIAVALVCLCVIAIAAFPKLKSKIKVINALSEARMNFRSGLNWLKDQNNEAVLMVVNYEDMGLSYHRDILPLSDYEKARRQKPMESAEIEKFLKISGNDKIQARSFKEMSPDSAGKTVYLMAMNREENDFILKTIGKREPVFSIGSNEKGFWIYTLQDNEIKPK